MQKAQNLAVSSPGGGMKRLLLLVGAVLFIALALVFIQLRRSPNLDSTATLPQTAPSSSSSTLTVGTSTASSVTVASKVAKKPFVQHGQPKLPSADGPLVDRLESLKHEASSGDPDVGYALGIELRECRNLDAQYGQLQQESSQAASQHSISDGARLDALDKRYERCKGIQPADLKDYGHWIELAARRGSVAAQVAYPTLFAELLTTDDHSLDTSWIENYKSNTLSFLSSAADGGSVDALNQLGGIYWDGSVTTRDPVTGYAYEFAVVQSGLIPSAPKLLDLWRTEMTPEQVQAAEQQGTAIYERCCR